MPCTNSVLNLKLTGGYLMNQSINPSLFQA